MTTSGGWLTATIVFFALCNPAERDLPQERDVDSVHRLVRQVDGANNRVELLLVIDFAAYSQFLARNSGNGTLAIAEIQRYYAGIVSQANERLAKLDLIDVFRLRIILAQIRVFTTAAESSVTEDLNNGDGIINSDAALVNFRTIAISLRPTNPHDYALLVTGTNANHDAQMNSCPNAFFVMSLTSAIPNARQFAGNPFDFSICSKQEMRSFLAQ
nr:hypothetical protein BaRGS_027803 [Batillaria attramentaria]